MVLQFQEVRNTLLIIISECSSLRGSFDCFLALLTDFQLVLAPLPSPVEICLDISTRTSRRWIIRCKDGRTAFRPKWIRIEQHVSNTDLRVTEHQGGVGWCKWVEQSNW